jgi:hypothetical protein
MEPTRGTGGVCRIGIAPAHVLGTAGWLRARELLELPRTPAPRGVQPTLSPGGHGREGGDGSRQALACSFFVSPLSDVAYVRSGTPRYARRAGRPLRWPAPAPTRPADGARWIRHSNPRRRWALAEGWRGQPADRWLRRSGADPGRLGYAQPLAYAAPADATVLAALTSARPSHEPPRSTLPLMFLPW